MKFNYLDFWLHEIASSFNFDGKPNTEFNKNVSKTFNAEM